MPTKLGAEQYNHRRRIYSLFSLISDSLVSILLIGWFGTALCEIVVRTRQRNVAGQTRTERIFVN